MSQPLADTAIEVVADTEPFEDDLDKAGRRARRRKITVEPRADTKTMLRDIETALDSFRGDDIEVDADTRKLIDELDRALDGFEGDIDLDPNVRRLVAEVDAALSGMKYDVDVEPRVLPPRDAKGPFTRLGDDLGDSTGQGFTAGFGKRLDGLKSLAGKIVSGFAPIAGIFAKAAAGAVALGGALTTVSVLAGAIGPAVVAGIGFLPGYLAARAAALGVFQLAVMGVSDAFAAAAAGDAAAFAEALEKLSPAAREFATAGQAVIDSLRPIQQIIQETAFAGLADDLTRAGAAMQGVRDDAASVALGFNRIAAEALGFAGSEQAVDAVNAALTNVRDILAGILPAVQPLLAAFAGLVTQAAQFGPAIGAGLGAGLGALADFLSRIDLAASFEAALPALRDIGDLVSNVGSIIASVFSASGASGTGLLGILADLTGQLAGFLDTAQGISGLQALMGAAGQVAAVLGDTFATILPPLAEAIGAVVPAIAPLAGVLGQVLQAVTPLLGPLGQLVAVLGGALVTAIQPLVPVIASLAGLIGGALTALAPVLGQVGQTIGAILAPAAELLADLFQQLAPYVQQLGQALGAALAPLLAVLGPLVVQLVDALLPLLPALVSLVPAAIQIVVALTPLIELLAELLTNAVAVAAPIIKLAASLVALLASKAVVPLINLIADALTAILSPLSTVASKLGEFRDLIGGIDWAAIGSAISGAFSAALDLVRGAIDAIVAYVTALPGKIGSALAALPGLVANIFRTMASQALQAIGVAIGLILYTFTALPGQIRSAVAAIPGILRTIFTNALNQARNAVTSGFNSMTAYISGIPGRISSTLSRLRSIFTDNFRRATSAGTSTLRSGLNNMVSLVASIPGRIRNLAGSFASAGARIVSNLVSGLRRVPSLGSIGSAIAGVIRSQANNIVAAINRGISSVDAILPGSLPRIGYFAQGVIADKPTLGVFGEDGREVVIPLTKPARARQLAEESGLDRILAGSGGDSPVYVSLRAYIGDTEITRMITFEVDRRLDETAAQVDAGVRGF